MAEKVYEPVTGKDEPAGRLYTRIDGATALLALALILGGLLRVAPAALSDFPLNDGGMFSVMVDELRANGFALPHYTSYNQAHIPYAYPPLGFYLGAAATSLGLSTLQALTWLPALLCVLTLPAFYFMARGIMATRMQAAIATALFALTPRALIWFLMGGGLTRSAGLLFSLLTIGCFVRLCEEETNHEAHQGARRAEILWLGLAVLCGSLTALSHLEAATMTAGAVLLILLIRYRTRAAFLASLAAGAGILLITAPWWGTVVARFGWAPFLSAAQTGPHKLGDTLGLILHFNPAEEPFFPLIAGLGLLGLLTALLRRDWLLPAWVGLAIIVDTRSRAWAAVIPLVLLGALALTEVLIPAIASLTARGREPARDFSNPFLRAFAYLLATLLLTGAALTAGRVGQVVLPEPDRQAMGWVRANTPAVSQFLVITGNLSPMQDPVTEWFPALADRSNLTTLQGSEWTAGSGFWQLLAGITRLQACFLQDAGCIADQAAKLRLAYDYIWIEKYNPDYPCPNAEPACANGKTLINSFKRTATPVYENEQVVVFGLE